MKTLPTSFCLILLSISSAVYAQQESNTAFPKKVEPMYIFDGKAMSSLVKSKTDTTKYVSFFENISPGDIESIHVLKGTDAIARFGEAGKNGVVIISSRKKKSDQ